MDVTKPNEFIGFGAMDATRPYEFTGFGAMDVPKPYEFIGFGAPQRIEGGCVAAFAPLPGRAAVLGWGSRVGRGQSRDPYLSLAVHWHSRMLALGLGPETLREHTWSDLGVTGGLAAH
jgi:hypothetical protein